MSAYERERLKNCVQNKSMLQQLGIPNLVSSLNRGNTTDRNKKQRRNCEDSGSEYNPKTDESGEDNLVFEAKQALKTSKKTSNKTSTTRSVDMAPGGVKKQNAKRVLSELPPNRATRLKNSLTSNEGDASREAEDVACREGVTTPSDDIHGLPLSLHPMSEAEEFIDESNGHELAVVQGNGLHHEDSDHLDDVGEANEDEGGARADVQTLTDGDLEGMEGRGCNRGRNMGKGLQRLCRARRGKLPVVIQEGKIRPLVPLVAAKFATECNIAVRNHVPVFKHWKDYKDKNVIFRNYIGRVGSKFDMNTSDATVKKACTEMMKSALRQQRYRLKKTYFDPFPLHLVRKNSPIKAMTDQQWNDLVEYWKNPKKMETCEKNKANRAQVKFHQTTGSRSYMVHCENLGDKYNDKDPDALDLFKECHYSNKKKGYTTDVQSAITKMETLIAEQSDDEQPKSVTDVVASVLAESTKKNRFLQNVGIHVEKLPRAAQNLVEELAAEKRANAELRMVVDSQKIQIDELSVKLHEAEQSRIRDKEEMNQKYAETDAKLELLLSKMGTS
ncbi:hypothetical protein ACP70R_043113 [Stipagrostis hirtigluma subsp. patula]